MIVRRSGRAQEGGASGNLQADLEAQRGRIEINLAIQAGYVEHGVVQAADGHIDAFLGRLL